MENKCMMKQKLSEEQNIAGKSENGNRQNNKIVDEGTVL
jgi:hypothetical protein